MGNPYEGMSLNGGDELPLKQLTELNQMGYTIQIGEQEVTAHKNDPSENFTVGFNGEVQASDIAYGIRTIYIKCFREHKELIEAQHHE